jgi:site-specific recombinase XerD
VKEYLAAEYRRRRGAGPAAVWSALASFWRWRAQEFETVNPMARIPRPPAPIVPTQVLTAAQLAAIAAATSGRDPLSLRNRLIVVLLAGTGMFSGGHPVRRRSDPRVCAAQRLMEEH